MHDALMQEVARHEHTITQLEADNAKQHVVITGFPVVNRESIAAMQARVSSALSVHPRMPAVSVVRRLGATGPIMAKVSLPCHVHELMQHRELTVEGSRLSFRPFETNRVLVVQRQLRPLLHQLRVRHP